MCVLYLQYTKYISSLLIVIFTSFMPFLCLCLFVSALGLHCCVGFFLVAVSGGYSLFRFRSFSLGQILLLRSTDFRAGRLQQLRCMGSVVVVPRLQSTGSVVVAHSLVTPHHVGSSQTWDQTHVSCIGRQILYH